MRLFLISGRRSVHVDVDLTKIDLSRPIAWRSLAQSVMLAINEITMRRGLTRLDHGNEDDPSFRELRP